MKEAILTQYNAIQQTIKANVGTIGHLLRQAEDLKSLVASVDDSHIKLSLEKQIAEIETTIGSLIHQTDEIFDQYQRFVERVFNGK